MDERVTPARPHHKLTQDGRRMREVLSYSRRGNRFTPNQAAAWASLRRSSSRLAISSR